VLVPTTDRSNFGLDAPPLDIALQSIPPKEIATLSIELVCPPKGRAPSVG
jgi:hypothetical protein